MCKAPYTRPRNSTGKTHRFARRVPCEAPEDLSEPNFPIAVKEIENMFSFWPDKILIGFLVEKCTHDRFPRQKKKTASFLLVFAKKLGRVYEAQD